jgi:hypothetical protein
MKKACKDPIINVLSIILEFFDIFAKPLLKPPLIPKGYLSIKRGIYHNPRLCEIVQSTAE